MYDCWRLRLIWDGCCFEVRSFVFLSSSSHFLFLETTAVNFQFLRQVQGNVTLTKNQAAAEKNVSAQTGRTISRFLNLARRVTGARFYPLEILICVAASTMRYVTRRLRNMLVQVGKNSAYILNLGFCSPETFE